MINVSFNLCLSGARLAMRACHYAGMTVCSRPNPSHSKERDLTKVQARNNIDVELVARAAHITEVGAAADDGGVIGAQTDRRDADRYRRFEFKFLPQPAVGGHPAGQEYLFNTQHGGGLNGLGG